MAKSTTPTMVDRGRVVEARPGLLILGPTPDHPEERVHEVEHDDVAPGTTVRIFDDGHVEVGTVPTLPVADHPEVTKETTIPTEPKAE